MTLYAWKNKKGKWLVIRKPAGLQTRPVIEFTRNLQEATVCAYQEIPQHVREGLARFEAKVTRKVELLENDEDYRGSGLYRARR